MEIGQGDIFWVDLGRPSKSAPGYLHPHVVVQNNVFNMSRISTVVVCAITTDLKRAKAPGNVLLERGEAGLPKASVVNVSQVFTVDKRDLTERIGTLPGRRIQEIVEGLQLLLLPRATLPTFHETDSR
ncbi:MAG: type II toxin-antitoxin system PemK/MazF family toxin [Candidatus Geothermincolia bacterium]